jgi:nicotinamidase-related amidase
MSSSRHDSDDLHGNVPDQCGVVLLLVDVINDLDFPDNEELVAQSVELAKRIRALKLRCRQAGIPAIYANDNRGKWRSDAQKVIAEVQREGAPGREFARMLAPEPDDYIVLKPKHSIFLASPLDLILEHLEAHTLVLAGVTTNSCVLISAGEAFARGYRVVVPRDCVAALKSRDQGPALQLMEESYGVQTNASGDLDLEAMLKPPVK